MNLELQNYLVYIIVFAAFWKFTQPAWLLIFRILFRKKDIIPADNSCYAGTCAKCKVKS